MPFGVEEIREFGAGMAFVLIFWMGAWLRGQVFSKGAMTALQDSHADARTQYEERLVELRREKEEYRSMVMRSLTLGERLTSVAEESRGP